MRFSLCNADTAGDVAAQIHQGVQLDRRFALTKPGPRKQGKTQIDGGGIENIGSLFELDSKVVVGVQLSCGADEDLGKLGINAPIPVLVGPRQGGPGNFGAKADMIQFGLERPKAGFDVAQALTPGQLGKGHAEELIQTGEPVHLVVAPVALNTASKRGQGKKLHELGKDEATVVHGAFPCELPRGGRPK